MRRTFAVLACLTAPLGATAEPIANLGAYTPAAFAKAVQDPEKAVLVHIVSKFCRVCEEQTVALSQIGDTMIGIDRHVAFITLPLETWGTSPVLDKLGAKKPGSLVLVKGEEVLGTISTADMGEMTTLLTPLMPTAAVDPATGLPLDPATGMPVDPSTGMPPA